MSSNSVWKISRIIFLVLANCLRPLCSGSELPRPVIPEGVGVNIHFVTGHEADLDLIKAAGFKFIRMDFQWQETEPAKGKYDWSGYDELMVNLDKRGLRALFILDYAHPLYERTVSSPHPITGQSHETTASPQHEESIVAFAQWAADAAKHFHGRHVIWEIWNEPNGNFWSPKPDANQYSALALATCKAIREAEPKATIVAPATAGFPWEFLETVFKSGALQYLDAVSVHPYRDPRQPPETAAGDYQKLRALIDRYAPAERKNLPILSGEWGYSTHAKGVTLETQAAFAARQQLFNLLNGIPLSIWYDWKNDGPDPNENEHNFGTVFPDLKPKPAYIAIRTLTRELSGYRVASRVAISNSSDYVLLCTNEAGNHKLAAWTLDEPHAVSLGIKVFGKAKVTAASGSGGLLEPKIEANRVILDLNAMPQYVSLGRARIRE